jgi:KDO2-lipid IV(A) lauroyltransferase
MPPFLSFFAPQYWLTWLGLFLLRLISSLPWRLVAIFADGLGYFFYVVYKSRVNIARKNIQTCFPEFSPEKVNETVLRSFQLGAQALFFTGVAWWASKKRYESLVEFDASALDQLMAQDKNIIVLTPHFVGLETAGVYLSIHRPFMTMYQYAKNPLINHYIVNKRGRFGGHLVERKEPLRKMLKLIKQKVPLYYLPDQDAGRKGRFTPFFGVQASTFDMLGKMTQLTDAIILPCSVEIKPKGKGMKIVVQPPLENFPTGDDQRDTEIQNKVIEDLIKTMPEQYLWAHKRFKTRPAEDSKAFYT